MNLKPSPRIEKRSKFIAKNNILTSFQFGLRKNHSTELPITTFYDRLLKNLDENKIKTR